MLAGQLSVGQLAAAMGTTAMVSGMWQLGTSLLLLQAGSTALDLLQQQCSRPASTARSRQFLARSSAADPGVGA